MSHNIEQIIGAKAGGRAFIMRDLLLSTLRPASLNSIVMSLHFTLMQYEN